MLYCVAIIVIVIAVVIVSVIAITLITIIVVVVVVVVVVVMVIVVAIVVIIIHYLSKSIENHLIDARSRVERRSKGVGTKKVGDLGDVKGRYRARGGGREGRGQDEGGEGEEREGR